MQPSHQIHYNIKLPRVLRIQYFHQYLPTSKNIIESLNPSTAVNINIFTNEKDTDELTIEINTPTTSTHTNLSNYIHLLHPIINNFYTINKSKSALTPFQNNTITYQHHHQDVIINIKTIIIVIIIIIILIQHFNQQFRTSGNIFKAT